MDKFSDLAERILDSAGHAIVFADGAGTIRRWSRAAHRSGRKLDVELTFALVSAGGTGTGAVAVARDVTERVERERAAAQRPLANSRLPS